jgi:hypothetical protein
LSTKSTASELSTVSTAFAPLSLPSSLDITNASTKSTTSESSTVSAASASFSLRTSLDIADASTKSAGYESSTISTASESSRLNTPLDISDTSMESTDSKSPGLNTSLDVTDYSTHSTASESSILNHLVDDPDSSTGSPASTSSSLIIFPDVTESFTDSSASKPKSVSTFLDATDESMSSNRSSPDFQSCNGSHSDSLPVSSSDTGSRIGSRDAGAPEEQPQLSAQSQFHTLTWFSVPGSINESTSITSPSQQHVPVDDPLARPKRGSSAVLIGVCLGLLLLLIAMALLMFLRRNDDSVIESEGENEWEALSEPTTGFDPFAEDDFLSSVNNEEMLMRAVTSSCEESTPCQNGFV